MPKILINEKDYTNPGAPNGYSNYSVLIAGFMGRKPVLTADVIADKKANPNSTLKADAIQPDSNGVYEFSSAQAFLDTIGPVAPHYENGDVSISHFGNQMAYELLKQGYSVIYLPIEPETCAASLLNANTWEIFKDKANYDFRFIYHGLLESTDESKRIALQEKIDGTDGNGGLIGTLQLLHNKGVIDFDRDALTITSGNGSADGPSYKIEQLTDERLENVYVSEEAYSVLYAELGDEETGAYDANLINSATGAFYTLGSEAAKAVLLQLQNALSAQSKNIDTATICTANANIANLAKYVADEPDSGRGDCVALIEMDENAYVGVNASGTKPESRIIAAINAMSDINEYNGKYCAMTVPSVVYNMSNADVTVNGVIVKNAFNGNNKFPGAFHYLTCFMSSLQSGFAEWYAAAGYTRGTSSYNVAHTTVTLGELAINALEPRNKADENSPKFACNVIANFRGSYYLWGNRTAHELGDANGTENDLIASHFLNIRQLCTTIKKQLYVACRRYTFDPNSDTLWFNFVNAIRPTLEVMKADQGIRDYKIMKVVEANPKKATLKAKIRIIPIEAVEDFDLEVSLEDSFGETTAVVTG